MNKNLKKVISAVAALAMSASTFTALAATFPDVPEDASYAQAVQELSALDVISGYDDGTFKPDELVTRAQITKMIVDALGERELAEASKANSQFADVNSAGENGHWAKGYINQGVTDKFIAGYDSTTFGPDDNVTYVQAQKMLVSAIGYETYAQEAGGWPNGYKVWASSQGITDGISGIADDTQLTRAQVAKLVDNAMGAPTCTVTWKTSILGNTPELTINNGEGKEYKTLFTMKHDAYKVYGRVMDTSRAGGSLPVDKVSFRVEKADNFNDQWIGSARNADEVDVTEEMYFGDTNAVDMLLTYSEALIQKDNDDEYHILSIVPAAASKSVTLAAEDFDKEKTDSENSGNSITKLYFFPAGSNRNSTKYAVASDAVIYINGVPSDYSMSDLVAYIDKNDTAAVTLEKQTNKGSTSTTTDYNLISVTSYDTAVVKSVVARNDQVTVNFEDQSFSKSRIIFYLDDEDKSYSVKYDGEEIDPADLQENDVLSIAWDNNDDGKGDPSDSSFLDVIVSRDVVSDARCTSENKNDGEYSFGSDVYKLSNVRKVSLEMSATYVLYLDHFGRIAKAEEDSVSKKIGILKNVYKKAGGDYYAQIITKEGTEEEYKVDTDNVTAYQAILKNVVGGEAVYDDTHKKSDLYPQQVVEYSVSSSSNKLTIKSTKKDASGNEVPAALTFTGGDPDSTYRASSEKIGTVKLADASVIMDLSDVDTKDNYSLVSPSTLSDGTEYTAYGYDETKSGSTYHRFVLITSGTTSYNYDTQLAVIKKVNEVSDDDSTKVGYDLVVNGEDASYVVDEDFGGADNYAAGDVILFTTNAAGYINDVQLVFAKNNMLGQYKYDDFRNDFLKANAKLIADNPDKAGEESWKGFFNGKDSDDVDIIWGVVAGSKGNNVVIGKPKTIPVPITDSEGNQYAADKRIGIDLDEPDDEFNYANAIIYTYNFGASTSRGNSRVSLDDGFIETLSNSAVEHDADNGHTWMDLQDEQVTDDIVFAVARIDGSDVLELYLIYND